MKLLNWKKIMKIGTLLDTLLAGIKTDLCLHSAENGGTCLSSFVVSQIRVLKRKQMVPHDDVNSVVLLNV